MHLSGRSPGFHSQRLCYVHFFPFLLALTISAHTAKGDAQSTKTPKTLYSTSNGSISRKPPEFDNYKEPCNFYCYLTSDNLDEVNCTAIPFAPPRKESTNIHCYLDKVERKIVIGNKSSVRRITPGGLRVLVSPRVARLPSSKTHLSLYLRLNILEMNATALKGLESVLQQIQIYNLHSLHPDTFARHRRLRAVTLDTATAPEFPRTLAAKLQQNDTDLPIRPFFRIFPEDAGRPFAFNMDVRCHRCGNKSEYGGEETENLVVITFPRERRPSTPLPPLNVLDSLSLLYLDGCPHLEAGLGCPVSVDVDNLNTTNKKTLGNPLLPYVVSELAPTGWSDDDDGLTNGEASDASAKLLIGGAHSSVLTTFLIVWCSLLTIVLLCICVVLFIRRQRLFTPKSLKSYTLRTPVVSTKRIINYSGSCEELTCQQAATALATGFNSNSAYQTPSLRSSNILLNHPSSTLRRPSRNSYAAGDGRVATGLHPNGCDPGAAAVFSPPLCGTTSLRGRRSLGQRLSVGEYDDNNETLMDSPKAYWGMSPGLLPPPPPPGSTMANGDARVAHFGGVTEAAVPDGLPPRPPSLLRSQAVVTANTGPAYKRSQDGIFEMT
ncbi:unnamed protein product [Schistocephalus solidus]|uniref:Uncharacterized protein n=1 Tax=Schistocephalus solidus TaxID=70667 RepID=A0A183SJG8_SCHSO|nr:unnamed protein product [Schistocephalus solidus]